jgi:cobalt-zinc-cadmium efflux system protein
MSHAHDHHDLSETRLFFALLINLMLTLAQIFGGAMAGSLALVADALHNLSDAGSLGVALIARRIAKRPADAWRTFGYQRAELIGALINLTALILIGLYLIYEAAMRYFHPEPIAGWIMIYVGGITLAVDALTAMLTYAGAKHSLNIRAAFLHNLADALGSVAVIASGSLILLYGWILADLVCTVLIATYVLYHGLTEISQTIRILMQSTPLDIDLAELIHTLEREPGVKGLHHVHVWEIDEHRRSLEGHVVIELEDAGKIEDIKQRLKRLLAQRYDIRHSTLEFEFQSQDGGLACLIEAHEPYSACGHPGREASSVPPPRPLPSQADLTLAAKLLKKKQ